MNANELADHMEKYFDSEPYCDEVVTMLRQQQAEITALKERLRPCNPLCKPSVCDCRPLNQTYDPKKHGAEE
jgi:hypothetical protein